MNTYSERTNKIQAGALSLLLHIGLLFLLMFTFLRTPIPPMGSGEGILVNIGYTDMGSGEVQPMSENITKTLPSVVASKTLSQQEENKVLTQNMEDAPEINTAENKKKIKTNIHRKKNKTETTVKEEKKEVQQQIVNPNALYHGRTNNSTSQGTNPNGTGDQGSPNGDANSKGIGDNGNSSGNSKGFSFSLSGRKLLKKPDIDDKSQETGKVVVTITVDRYGSVTKATPGARGSTTTSSILYQKAKEAALKMKFDANSEAPEEQRGTLTFIFILN